MEPICPYCDEPSELVKGDVVYPHRKDLYKLFFYMCEPCEAYVGCHGKTFNPLGRLANAELRKAKSAAHRAFDPLWRDGHMSRSAAYKALARKLNLSKKECHIGMFDVPTCKQVEKLIKPILIESLND